MKKLFFSFISLLMLMPVFALAHAGEVSDGGDFHMMDWHWGNGGGMMGGGFGVLAFLTWFVWLVVGVLAAIYLWQKINKK